MKEVDMPAERSQPDAIIEVDRRLSDEEADALREHVELHGLVDLPFGAQVRAIPE
ncbi:hypothetical protein [Streptomyces sp. A3M-1-3]|uniref:hypothetical protein n=1 Tax=Streptomyces sp. A3M-1-3 TaxID=2962044 RepID=UPI0020B735F9|nr:hypothetical protein [Streptomyces sp. A3M-1-3]